VNTQLLAEIAASVGAEDAVCMAISDNKTLQASRLQLVIAVQQILQNGLGLPIACGVGTL
jgi:arginyl-tRNA synthetase